MVRFQITTVKRGDTSIGVGTSGLYTAELPKANAISRVFFQERAAHASAITITQSKVEVIANGNAGILTGLTGTQLRKVMKHENGTFAVDTGAGGALHQIDQTIHFGRAPRELGMALPGGNRFQSLQLQVTFSLSATPTAHTFEVVIEELLDVGNVAYPFVKRSVVGTRAGAAGRYDVLNLPRGLRLRKVFIDYADVDNVDGDTIKLGVNNFARVIFDAMRSVIEGMNVVDNRYDDATVPTTCCELDLDPLNDLNFLLDTREAAGVSDVGIQMTGASSGTSGTIAVITEEVVGLAQ